MNTTAGVLRFLAVILFGWLIFIQAHAAEAPWTHYFGSHYDQSAWGMSIRDPGGPGRYGYRTPGSRQPPAKWAGQGDPVELRPYLERGPVLLNVGGLGSGRDDVQTRNFLDGVRRDGGAVWKRELAARVRQVAVMPGAMEQVYWQFGNEINGPRFLRNVVDWGGEAGRDREAALQKFIPLYVEYFLAPGVEAVRAVSQELHGDPGRIRVMLGSLANARDPRAIRWYEALLNYPIQGSYAPSLAGKKVHDVVSALSIHYLVSAEDQGWTAMLDQLADNWMGKGAIRAIWSTEEIGVRRAQAGYGAATALGVAARYLNWWSARGWNASHGHCFFWGSEMGPSGARADDALNTLLRFTGPVALRPLPGGNAGGLENYQFSVGKDDKRVHIALAGGGEAPALSRIHIPVAGWGGAPRAKVLLYTPQGERQLQASIQRMNEEFQVSFRDPLRLARGEAMMILLEKN